MPDVKIIGETQSPHPGIQLAVVLSGYMGMGPTTSVLYRDILGYPHSKVPHRS